MMEPDTTDGPRASRRGTAPRAVIDSTSDDVRGAHFLRNHARSREGQRIRRGFGTAEPLDGDPAAEGFGRDCGGADGGGADEVGEERGGGEAAPPEFGAGLCRAAGGDPESFGDVERDPRELFGRELPWGFCCFGSGREAPADPVPEPSWENRGAE